MEAVMAPYTKVSRAYRKGQVMRDHLYWRKSSLSSAVYSASFVYLDNF